MIISEFDQQKNPIQSTNSYYSRSIWINILFFHSIESGNTKILKILYTTMSLHPRGDNKLLFYSCPVMIQYNVHKILGYMRKKYSSRSNKIVSTMTAYITVRFQDPPHTRGHGFQDIPWGFSTRVTWGRLVKPNRTKTKLNYNCGDILTFELVTWIYYGSCLF